MKHRTASASHHPKNANSQRTAPLSPPPGFTAGQIAAAVSLARYEALLRKAYATALTPEDGFHVGDCVEVADATRDFREAEQLFRQMAGVFREASRHAKKAYLRQGILLF